MAADPLDRIAEICHDQPHDALTKIAEVLGFREFPPRDMTAMVDAAMVEMSNIHPPLRRSECERLIRAALGVTPTDGQVK